MRIIVTNQKGGAGKPTTILNVAGALNQRDHNSLVIDVNPQSLVVASGTGGETNPTACGRCPDCVRFAECSHSRLRLVGTRRTLAFALDFAP